MPSSQPWAARDRIGDPSLPDMNELGVSAKERIRILVIDDERTLRESCRTFLSSEGYGVEVCGRGDEALELLRRREFDIVMIDQYMSDVPGAVLLEASLAKNPDTVCIVMTGNPTVEADVRLESGATAWAEALLRSTRTVASPPRTPGLKNDCFECGTFVAMSRMWPTWPSVAFLRPPLVCVLAPVTSPAARGPARSSARPVRGHLR